MGLNSDQPSDQRSDQPKDQPSNVTADVTADLPLSFLLRLCSRPIGTFLIVLAAYSLGLWWYSVPFTGDEKVYVTTAMEMWLKKSWLHPVLFGERSYFKPPFQYWATLLGWKTFGFGNLGTYFPSALATAGTAWLMVHIGKLLRSDQTAPKSSSGGNNFSGIWFAGSTGTLTYGSTAQMEIWVVFFYMLVWCTFLFFDRSCRRDPSKPRWGWFYLALIFSGISGLVKSPLYSCFSVLGMWLYLLLSLRLRPLKSLHFWIAHLVGFLFGLSWFVFAFITDRDRFFSQYFQYETVSKSLGNGSTPQKMWLDSTTFCIPFLIFLVPTALYFLGYSLKNIVGPAQKRLVPIFLIASLVIPAVFFTFFPYRTETYLYILIPSIIIGMDYFAETYRKGRIAWLGVSRVNGLIIAALVFASALIFMLGGVIPVYLGCILLVLGLLFLRFSWKFQWPKMALTSLAMITAIKLGGAWLGESDIRVLKETLKELPGRELRFFDATRYIWHEIGILSVGVQKPAELYKNPEDLINSLKKGDIVVLSDTQKDEILPLISQAFSQQPLEVVTWWRWKRGFVVPTFRDLVRLGNRLSPEWQARNQREYKICYLK